jgi:hypothetical protein
MFPGSAITIATGVGTEQFIPLLPPLYPPDEDVFKVDDPSLTWPPGERIYLPSSDPACGVRTGVWWRMRAWIVNVVFSLILMSSLMALGYGLAAWLTDVEGHIHQSELRTHFVQPSFTDR